MRLVSLKNSGARVGSTTVSLVEVFTEAQALNKKKTAIIITWKTCFSIIFSPVVIKGYATESIIICFSPAVVKLFMHDVDLASKQMKLA